METSKRLVMHQVKYATEILRKFETIEYNPAVTQAETRIKTEEASDEEPVEPTMFKGYWFSKIILPKEAKYLFRSRIG